MLCDTSANNIIISVKILRIIQIQIMQYCTENMITNLQRMLLGELEDPNASGSIYSTQNTSD